MLFLFTKSFVGRHLDKLGIDQEEISRFEEGTDGDMIRVYLPEVSVDDVRDLIQKNKFYRNNLDSFGNDFFNIKILENVEGNKTLYRIIFSQEISGVSMTVLVKRIDYYKSNGTYVPLLGYGMLREMKIDEDILH